MTKIVPCLWFNDRAEEAAQFYVSQFPDARVVETTHVSEAGPGEPGSVLTVEFELAGHPFTALNGGADFDYTEALSLQVLCDGQAEVDAFWAGLTADGGSEGPCGWLKDRYGVSWQIVPQEFLDLVSAGGEQATRATAAMLTMKKLDVAALQAAAAG